MKPQQRYTNYFFVHDRQPDELLWVRISDLSVMRPDMKPPVVLINGGYDILHSGHMKVIFAARRQASTLICALDSDARVARKGQGRPVLSWIERATALQYMPIDYIVEIETDKDFRDLVYTLKPDLRVQGLTYREQASKYPWIQKAYVRDQGLHTTEIIRRCKECL